MSASLILVIGNSHYHWAWLDPAYPSVPETNLVCWDTGYFRPGTETQNFQEWITQCLELWRSPRRGEVPAAAISALEQGANLPPLYYASVVPIQSECLAPYPRIHPITLADIPLTQVYENLGVDRALALWAAGELSGWPTIVIDGGTALTFTGGKAHGEFVGGAILPGLGLQFQSLAQQTAALPLVSVADGVPRWARNTAESIQSGIGYTVRAGMEQYIQAWLEDYPTSTLYFTGGDGAWLRDMFAQTNLGRSGVNFEYRSDLVLQGIIHILKNSLS